MYIYIHIYTYIYIHIICINIYTYIDTVLDNMNPFHLILNLIPKKINGSDLFCFRGAVDLFSGGSNRWPC